MEQPDHRKEGRTKYTSFWTLRKFYRDYIKNNKDIPMEELEYAKYAEAINKKIAEMAVNSSFGVKFPYGEAGELGTRIYEDKKRSDLEVKLGISRANVFWKRGRIYWNKKSGKIRNLNFYTFVPSRPLKKAINQKVINLYKRK